MTHEWIGRAILAIGVWVMASPWLVPFLGINAIWNDIFSGAIIVICGLWWLFGDKSSKEAKL